MNEFSVENSLTIFDLAWDDILFTYVLPHLTLKDLFNFRCVSRLSKEFVEESFSWIKEINLSGNCSENIDKAFKVLGENCQRLEIINLAKCDWLNDELFLPIARLCKNIKKVNLTECNNLTVSSIQPIIIDCKRLRILKLSKCYWLTIGMIEALTLHQPNIVELDISHCTISERCIKIFLLNSRNLSVLSVAYITSVGDNLLWSIAKNSKEIKHLNVIGCTQITDRGVRALSLYCSSLESLMLRDCPLVSEQSLSLLRGKVFIDVPKHQDSNRNEIPRLVLQV